MILKIFILFICLIFQDVFVFAENNEEDLSPIEIFGENEDDDDDQVNPESSKDEEAE
jgi:hypothetical protein